MTRRPQFAPRTHRASELLAAVGRAYPGAWQALDDMRRRRGAALPRWPDWCYVPLHGAYAVVSGGGDRRVPLERSHHVGIVGALAAWRIGQVVVRYDPALYAPLIETPITGELPAALLYRLPVWCAYLETPDLAIWGRRLHGAWVHLDWDEGGPDELRLLLDMADRSEDVLDPVRGLVPLPLLLGDGSIADALERVIASGQRQAVAHGYAAPRPAAQEAADTAAALAPLLSLVLYLCAGDADWGERGAPADPLPVRTRRDGWRLFPAQGLRIWDVGVRLGAALRRAYAAQETGQPRPHAGPRGHIRRAHWHTYLSGPRRDTAGAAIPPGERRAELRWQPPIPVALGDADALPTTVRPVR